MSVPNQKKILIQRTSEKDRANFLKVSNTNLETAMYNLTANAFKLWIYFVDNKNGYSMDLYPIDFCTKAQVSDSTYRRAFKQLQEKGYLVKSKIQTNLYLFKEESCNSCIRALDEVKSIDTSDFEQVKKQYFQ